MKWKLFVFFVVLAGFVVGKTFYATGSRPGWFEAVDFSALPKSCAQVASGTSLTLGGAGCKEVGFTYKFKSPPRGPLWIRAVVTSFNYRSGLHVLSNGVWHYSYHSGDGKEQVLLTEIKNPSSTLEFILTASESDPEPSKVKFGEIVFSAPGETSLGPFVNLSNTWLRTNDPNKDFWFDRYTSPTENFTVTFANPGNNIWEHFFGIGVNDASNTGDYFCYPDDKLLFLKDNKPTWFYLGALTWKRTVRQEGARLVVRFEYDGPLRSGAHMKQPHAISILKQNFLKDPEDLGIEVHLSKEYVFDLHEPKMTVHVDSGSLANKSRLVYWIIEDGPYMDFQASNQMNVHSLVGDKLDHQAFYSSFGGNQRLPRITLFRDRLPENQSIAATYSSEDYHMTFLNNAYLARYLDEHRDVYKTLQDEEDVSMASPNHTDWFFGIGFDLRKTPRFSFVGHFVSGFEGESSLKEKLDHLKK